METFEFVLDAQVAYYLKLLIMTVVFLLAVGRTLTYLYNEFQSGKLPTIEVINTATDKLLTPIEQSELDEWLEEKYLALDNEEFKKMVNLLIDIADPGKLTDATEARIRLHKFLSDTTDGDLDT